MARKRGELEFYNDVDINVRKKIKLFLSNTKPVNLSNILNINKQISNELKYEKAFYFIRNHRKTKGFLILFSIFTVFFRKYKFRKNLELRINKMISKIPSKFL
jgi:hypothetical protein